MKKVLAIIMTLVLVFSFSACGEIEDIADGITDAVTSATKSNYALNETAKTEIYSITATELKESKGSDFFKPEKGKVFVGINFTIENISDEDQSLSSLLSFTAYADDVKCDYSISAAASFSDGTLDGDIAAGKKLVGWYSIEAPENWSKIDIEFVPELLSDEKITFNFTK